MTRSRILLLTALLLVPLLVVLAGGAPSASAQTLRLYGTMGYGGQLSTLYELNPDTGEILREVGPVGYLVNGLAYDRTTGTLYGSTSVNDITAVVARESKDLRVGGMVRDFVRQLDELLMLDSPRFHEAHRALREAYHPLEIRPAALEGHAYPAARAELEVFLDGTFAQATALRDAAGQPAAASDALPRALLARSKRMFPDLGYEESALGVDSENLSQAFRLYESVGFRVVNYQTVYRKAL